MWAFLVAQMVKVFSCTARDLGLIPGSRISLQEWNGYPLQYSCLENPVDRGAWQATDHGVAESDMTDQATHTPQLVYNLLMKCQILFMKNCEITRDSERIYSCSWKLKEGRIVVIQSMIEQI